MGKKRGCNNGFYYFMLDFKNRQGRNFKSMEEVAAAAGPFWARMSKNERSPFDNMAKLGKENQRKQTTIGESIDFVLQEELEKKNHEQNAKKEIDKTINVAVKNRRIAEEYFYIMHINDFCFCTSENRFYPSEIALGKFNLQEGIKISEVYHSIVHPGPLPLGYANEAKRHSDETHQIPPPMGPNAENNMEDVLASIINYLSDENEAGDYPPIYVHEKQIKLVENILDNMRADFGHVMTFKIYPLQYLFFALRNSVSKSSTNVWPTVSVSVGQLDKDVYDFCKGIACLFHENTDTPIHCSRSRIIRSVYIICDNCIKDLEIEPILGQHLPFNAMTSSVLKRPGSATSFRSTHSTYQPNSMYETPLGSLMPSRSESRMSSVSERSSTVADIEFTSYKGFDTDSQISVEDEEQWQMPKSRSKQRQTSSTNSSQQDEIKVHSASQNSYNSDYVPKRRPISVSAAVRSPGSVSGRGLFVGRGRGRGIKDVAHEVNQLRLN